MAFTDPKDLMQRAATSLRLRNMAARTTQMRPHMRPHTYVFLTGEKDTRISQSSFLGVVFHEWPKHFTNLKFKLEMDQGELETTGTFCAAVVGEEKMQCRGLVVPERWCWMSMIKKYTGLSAGNL